MPVRDLSVFSARTLPLRTVPDDTRHVAGDAALQRVFFQTGRTLTASALQLEAGNLDARRGLLGRVLADGVVEGLQVTLKPQTETPGGFTIGPGYAVSPNGQDLTVDRTRALDLGQVLLETPDGSGAFSLPGVGVLALRPVVDQEAAPDSIAGHVSGFAWDQQRDPGSAPYADLRFVDGVELVFVKLPGFAALATAPNGLNAASQALITAERTGDPVAQFTQSHVSLALIGVGPDGAITWIARHGAARTGGGLLPRAPRMSGGLNLPAHLRKASVDSMLEQLAAWRATNPGTPLPDGLRHLPSAGMVAAPGGVVPDVFPGTYARSYAPVRLSELDLLLQRSAALAPYDLTTVQDEVCWHIPVPDRYYEQELLLTPTVSQDFLDAVETMWGRVEVALADRRDLRAQSAVVEGRLDMGNLTDFGDDPNEVQGEDARTLPTQTDVGDFDAQTETAFDAWFDAINDLHITSEQRGLIEFHSEGSPEGVIPFQKKLTEALKSADDVVDFGFTRVQADIYRLRQSLLDNEEATKLATFPILAGIAQGSNALAQNRSLQEYFSSVKDERQTSALALLTEPAAALSPEVAFFVERDSIDTTMAIEGFAAESELAAASGVLRGSSSVLALAQAETKVTSDPLKLFGGVDAELKYETSGGTGLILNEAIPERQTGLPAQDFLSDVYKNDNIYGQLFEESRTASTQDYALKTLEDRQAGIRYASAIPGAYQDLRTTTIAERLKTPVAMGARTSALRVKADALSSLQALEISLEGVRAPIVGLQAEIGIVTRDQFDTLLAGISTDLPGPQIFNTYRNDLERIYNSGNDPVELILFKMLAEVETVSISDEDRNRLRLEFERLRLRIVKGYAPIDARELPSRVLEEWLDPTPDQTDEAAYFTAAVAILESVVSAYRAAEKRIAAINGLIANTRKLIATLQDIRTSWFEALNLVDGQLAEARHDLNAALALLEEEQARVAALDARRRDVLARHARVAVFARPRRMMPHSAGITSARILPGVFEDPLPAALRSRIRLPVALETMLEMLRDVPLDWFAGHPRLTDALRKPDLINRAVHFAANAAAVRLNTVQTTSYVRQLTPLRAPSTTMAQSLQVTQRITGYYSGLAHAMLKARASTDLVKLPALSWRDRKARALKVLSLSDLIEAGRDTRMAARALAEIENIENVTSSLLQILRQAPAAVRLIWADQLSVFDDQPKLLRASDLPGWNGLDLEMRRSILRLVQWLFQRAASDRPEAKRLMGDIVHVTVLSAAHAETDQIVTARLDTDKTVGASDTIEVVVDKGSPDIGTRVDFGLGTATQVWGTVEDITGNRASIRINPGFSERVTLTKTTKVFAAGYGPAKALSHAR